jgi:nifR3 family TIM-barrel protein
MSKPLPKSDTQAVPGVRIGNRQLASRFFLAPLAGYTQLPFRRVMRRLGGLGLATTDLVQAAHLLSQTRKSMQLVETSDDDKPLSVQIFSGHANELVAAAQWLEEHGYQSVDINMGCPMAKVNGQGGGARLMCDMTSASKLVGQVVNAVSIPVTVKMRLGWDASSISSPVLARSFEQEGCAAITIHGRTRAQGFHGNVDLDGIAATVDAVESIPVVGNGDVRTPEDALRMLDYTGCAAVAIGRGAMLDPWIFQRLSAMESDSEWLPPSPSDQVAFLAEHFQAMAEQHDDYACILFRKFAAWYGARLGIPETLEDKLRRIETPEQFEALLQRILAHHGERRCASATALIKVPNGPVSHW